MHRKNTASSYVLLVLALFIGFGVLYIYSPSLRSHIPQEVRMTLDQGIEYIESKSVQISRNLKLEEVRKAGLKVTETSLQIFGQICNQLEAKFGPVTVYVDYGAKVTFVYAPQPNPQADPEVYYVQFND